MSAQRHSMLRWSRLIFLFIGMLVMGVVIAGGILMGLELNKRNVSLRHTENELYLAQHKVSA